MSQAAGNIIKELQLDWSAVPPGRVRVLPDGRIGKFGWKAQFATLEGWYQLRFYRDLLALLERQDQFRP